MHGRFTTHGAEETERLGARLSTTLAAGELVLVEGELGAGKTTFVRGAARALGVRVPVTSPTFTIGQRYPARDDLVVAHLDLYRLGRLSDEDPDLLDDYLGRGAIAFVEWPGRELDALAAFARPAARVRLEHADGDGDGDGPRSFDRRIVTVGPA